MVRLKVGEHICNDRYKPDESSQVNAAPFSYSVLLYNNPSENLVSEILRKILRAIAC